MKKLLSLATVMVILLTVQHVFSAEPARIIYPTPGSTMEGPGSHFAWTLNDASYYDLYIYSNGEFWYKRHNEYNRSHTNSPIPLPDDGETITVKLRTYNFYTKEKHEQSFTYTAYSDNKANIIWPNPRSTLWSTSITFRRNDIGMERYWLDVGASPCRDLGQGGGEYFSGFFDTTAMTVDNLPDDGSPICVRLRTRVTEGLLSYWKDNKYSYTAYTNTNECTYDSDCGNDPDLYQCHGGDCKHLVCVEGGVMGCGKWEWIDIP